MGTVTDQSKRLSDVIERNRLLYSDPNIDATIQGIISPSPQSGLSEWDILRTCGFSVIPNRSFSTRTLRSYQANTRPHISDLNLSRSIPN